MFSYVRKISSYIFPLLLLSVLFSCEEKKITLPDGFEYVWGKGGYHFIYIDPKKMYYKDKVKIRRGGKLLCEEFEQVDYCEVYFWEDKSLIIRKLPLENREDVSVIYQIINGKVRVRILK